MMDWTSFVLGILTAFATSFAATVAGLAWAGRKARRYQSQVRGGYSRTVGGGWPK